MIPTYVKVIISDGVVEAVMADDDNVEVEIIDINQDYEDYEQLKNYRDEIYHDHSFGPVECTTAHFPREDDEDRL